MVTFVVPMAYAHTVPTTCVINRGLALAALCVAIVDSGHSVEIWSGCTAYVRSSTRFRAMVKVLAAGEPLDLGRLAFAVAHPGMLRRLAFGLWDGQPPAVARTVAGAAYGHAPFDCRDTDLPAEARGAYLFPYLSSADTQWTDR